MALLVGHLKNAPTSVPTTEYKLHVLVSTIARAMVVVLVDCRKAGGSRASRERSTREGEKLYFVRTGNRCGIYLGKRNAMARDDHTYIVVAAMRLCEDS